MRFTLRSTLLACLLLAVAPVFAANTTPAGTWKQIDDTTHKPKSIIQIIEVNGTYKGQVLKVLQSDDGPHPVCKKCDGERHNKPVEGMTIMWGVTRNGDVWDGGKILDPKSGKIYKVKLSLSNNGNDLKVRGYIGFSLFGRTQVWHRIQAPESQMAKPPEYTMPTMPATSGSAAPSQEH